MLFAQLGEHRSHIPFEVRSGELGVRRENGHLVMDFLAKKPEVVKVSSGLLQALVLDSIEAIY